MAEDDLSDLQGLQLDTDGSVTKSFRRRGTGKLRPARGERVTCHVVARLEEGGRVFASTRDSAAPLQFVIGDTTVEGRMDLTDIPSGLNEGLVTMALGEVASFKLAASKAHGEAGLTTGAVPVPPGATVDYEVELLSWAQDLQKDGGLLLTRAVAAGGSGAPADRVCPTDLTTVRMRYISREATSQTVVEDFSSGDGVEFMIDDGTVMLGLELAAKHMQAGEKARLEINTVGPGGVQLPYGYASMPSDHPQSAVTGPLVLELELLPFTLPKAVESLSGAERLIEVERVRELGVRKFQAGQIARARRRFERALTVASHRNLFAPAAGTGADPATPEESERLQEHRAALSNNIAACCVKLEEWDDTLTATATTLQIKPEDTKALYRQGLAYNRLGSYDRAKKALKRASRLEAAKEKLADRALLRLIKAELNGVTNQGLERNKEKEKETWGGKLQSTEPQETRPTGLIAKAATAIGTAVGVQRKPAKGSGESPLSPKKKKKMKSGQHAQADQTTAGAAATKLAPERPGAVAPAVTKPWWSVLRKIAPTAGVVLVLLFMLRRRR